MSASNGANGYLQNGNARSSPPRSTTPTPVSTLAREQAVRDHWARQPRGALSMRIEGLRRRQAAGRVSGDDEVDLRVLLDLQSNPPNGRGQGTRRRHGAGRRNPVLGIFAPPAPSGRPAFTGPGPIRNISSAPPRTNGTTAANGVNGVRSSTLTGSTRQVTFQRPVNDGYESDTTVPNTPSPQRPGTNGRVNGNSNGNTNGHTNGNSRLSTPEHLR